jgi:hypothetical protein
MVRKSDSTATVKKASKSDGITVVVDESETSPRRTTKSKFGAAKTLRGSKAWIGNLVARRASVAPETLQNNFTAFLGSMGRVIEGIPAFLGGYALDEIELSLEVEPRVRSGCSVPAEGFLALACCPYLAL